MYVSRFIYWHTQTFKFGVGAYKYLTYYSIVQNARALTWDTIKQGYICYTLTFKDYSLIFWQKINVQSRCDFIYFKEETIYHIQ